MLLARNLAANAGNQVWTFALNIAVLPVYLALLGPESYALVGFGLTIQIWATLLDAGMSPTLSRDMARYRAGGLAEDDVLSFVRSLDWVCLAVIMLVSAIGFATRNWWSANWFRAEDLSGSLIGTAMALVIAFSVTRWAGSLYRSALMGLERQVFANMVNAAANTLRLLLPVPLLYLGYDVRLLFLIWVIVAAVELAVLRVALERGFSRRLPIFFFSGAALVSRWRLAGGIAFLSLISLLVTQIDKLVLARLLPMRDYGYFTLAVVASNAMLMLAYPIFQAFQPRLSAAATTPNRPELARLFHLATQLTAVATLAPAMVLAALPGTAIFAWTGDAAAAEAVRPYLGFYVLGSALVGVSGLCYAVQLAYGNIRLHIIANILFAALLVPGVFVVATGYGAYGAALLWLAMNLALLCLYCPIVLGRFLPGGTGRWFVADMGLPALAAATIALGAHFIIGDAPAGRLVSLLVMFGVGGAAFAAATLATPITWQWIGARSAGRAGS